MRREARMQRSPNDNVSEAVGASKLLVLASCPLVRQTVSPKSRNDLGAFDSLAIRHTPLASISSPLLVSIHQQTLIALLYDMN